LFCEDNPIIQKLISATLRSSGHEVLIVADGLLGLAEIEREPPDAVFTDLAMPEIDGFELCSRIKSQPHLAHIPVVVVSASAQRHQIDEAYQRGAVDYVAKPFSPATLRVKVAEILARYVPEASAGV
jgi:CheY-like chemotaxis protein